MDDIKNNVTVSETMLTTLPLFLCNDDGRLPSFAQISGNWDELMGLVEQRKFFYSRLYKNRVTYLSERLYWCVKPYKQRLDRLSPKARELFEFIDGFGEITTSEIKNALMLSSKDFSKCINELAKELLVTAVAKEREINNNWSSFYWGTYRLWERTARKYEPDEGEAYAILEEMFSDREIKGMLK